MEKRIFADITAHRRCVGRTDLFGAENNRPQGCMDCIWESNRAQNQRRAHCFQTGQ